MSLSPGVRLGPYEITALIGEGGMGKVWCAHHIALNRDDALKVLPDAFASDPDRLARFRREAQVLASLNHSNIAHVYGLEQSNGVQALVMELVEGPTLADRIAQGPIPVDEALPIAKQIGEALEAAHEQGVIHRDLKPANIKVRPDGTVKVLDFGLAKLAESGGSGQHAAGASLSPTITSPAMTGVGVLLGTAAYMAPEQARGREADKRADIWAFGCVVFEMLTGRRAFEGDEVSDTLASVLKLDPPWNRLSADVPVRIRQTLRACLQKDPKQRIGDAQSLRLALNGAFEIPASDESVVAATIPPVRRRIPWIAAVAMLIALIAVGIGAWMFMRTPPQPPAIMRFTIALPEGKTLSTTGRSNIAISPDGSTIVYASDNRLFSRRLNDFEATPIRGTETLPRRAGLVEGLSTPAFSPDGRSVVFFSPGDATLKRVGLNGGTPVTMCAVDPPYGITWDSSGLLIGQGTKGVARCPGIGSSLQQLAKVREGEEVHGPQLLPGTDLLLFTVSPTRDGADRWDRANVVVQSLSSGQRTTIIQGGSDAKYLASGHLVYGVGGTIFAVSFDPRDPTHVGEPVPVVQGVQRTITGTTGVVHFATSQSGTMVYVPGSVSPRLSERAIAVATREGSVERLAPPNGSYVSVRVSRDGRFLAVGSDDSKEANISIFALDGTSAMRRLTFAGHNRFPVWSPDGARVAYQSDRDGDAAIFVQRADGTGTAERLTRPAKDEAHIPESWSSDGRTLLFSVRQDPRMYSVWTLSLSDRHVQPFGDIRSQTPIDPIFSPDGRWIAYSTTSGGVNVQPFPPTGARYEAPRVIADFHPVWTPDGNFLAYVPSAASGQLAVVRVTKGTSITFGVPMIAPAVVTGRATSGNPRVYDVLPDGRFVGLIIPGYESITTFLGGNQMRAVVNWAEELKRLVPTK